MAVEQDDMELDAMLDDEQQGNEAAAAAGAVTEPKAKTENDEMRAALAELAGTVNKIVAPKEKEAAPLTPQQEKEYWALFDPEESKPDFMKKWFRMNPEATEDEIKEAREMWKHMQEGIVKQAVVGSRRIAAQEFEKLRQEFAPVLEYVSQAKAEATRNRFFSRYESLSDPKFDKIIKITARDLAEQQFDSEDAYFKALAESAAETLRAYVPDFDLGAATTTKPAGQKPRLPRTTVGGTGGAGAGASQKHVPRGDATSEFLDD